MDLLRQRFGLAESCEVTFEMDPGTFDQARLDAFLDAGITRVSVGVQSFDDALLEQAGRTHDASEARAAIDMLLEAAAQPSNQLACVSVDLIGGLPHQTRESWRQSLEYAGSCGAHHVSVYDLQLEPGTAFGARYRPGVSPMPSEEAAADFFRDASEVLR